MTTHSPADYIKMSKGHLTWLWDGCLLLGCGMLTACTAHDMTCWRHCECCHRTWYWGHWCLLLEQQQQTTELYNVSKWHVNIIVTGRWIHYVGTLWAAKMAASIHVSNDAGETIISSSMLVLIWILMKFVHLDGKSLWCRHKVIYRNTSFERLTQPEAYFNKNSNITPFTF